MTGTAQEDPKPTPAPSSRGFRVFGQHGPFEAVRSRTRKQMNTNTRRLTARLRRPIRFPLPPEPPAASRAEVNARLTELKDRLTRQHLTGAKPEVMPSVLRAANDAASVAWATGFPLLVFPALFEERAVLARGQAARQAYIRQRTSALLGLAA